MIDSGLYYGYDTVKKCTTRVTQLKGGKAVLDFTKLELNASEPVYVQIVTFVKRQIFTGTAEKGESLPLLCCRCLHGGGQGQCPDNRTDC